MYLKIISLFLLLCLSLPVSYCESEPEPTTTSAPESEPGSKFEDTCNLSDERKKSLEKLKAGVQDELPHDYMKEDIYLVRFLRAQEWDPDAAIKMVKKMVKWRKDNDVDKVMEDEDMKEFETDYPVFFDGVDKQGRVVMEAPNFGKWKVSKAANSGKMDKLKRYAIRLIETATTQVRQIREKDEKSNVSHWTMLLNSDGFNERDNGCWNCMPYYSYFTETYEKYYPFSTKLILMVNSPKSFDSVLEMIRPMMNEQTREALVIFDKNEKKWKPFVQQNFDNGEIAECFGGTKKRDIKEAEGKDGGGGGGGGGKGFFGNLFGGGQNKDKDKKDKKDEDKKDEDKKDEDKKDEDKKDEDKKDDDKKDKKGKDKKDKKDKKKKKDENEDEEKKDEDKKDKKDKKKKKDEDGEKKDEKEKKKGIFGLGR